MSPAADPWTPPRSMLSAATRAGLGLVAVAMALLAVSPRRLPRLAPLLDPATHATEVTAFGLRCVATAIAAYLGLVFLALALGSLRLLPAGLHRVVTRWTARGLAGGLRRLVGASALAVGILPMAPVAAQSTPPPVLAPAEPAGAEPATRAPRMVPAPTTAPPSATPTAVPPPTTSAPAVARQAPDPDPPPPWTRPAAEPSPAPRGPAAPPATVTVAAGESFWSITVRLVEERLGRAPADDEVIEPWLALIAANRDRLVDPGDPGLLHPGQVLRVPRPAG